ncbi:MAG: sodium:proton antiporter NhaD [Deltaproteobacteria bacterium]|nr:sodium:proton antiporter NhaD [Deltaproteobacteria bacterium]
MGGFTIAAGDFTFFLIHGKSPPVKALSAAIDNIPVIYAVLQMNPPMDVSQWLLITLTAGTGGSLLSIGSAAGVAVMGVRRDIYTFSAHLKWMPVIAIGYFASIGCWWVMANWIR